MPRASEERPNERYLTFRNSDVPIMLDISDPQDHLLIEDPTAWEASKQKSEEAQKWT